METYNGTDEHFAYEIREVKKDESKNIFTVSSMIELKDNVDNDWKV